MTRMQRDELGVGVGVLPPPAGAAGAELGSAGACEAGGCAGAVLAGAAEAGASVVDEPVPDEPVPDEPVPDEPAVDEPLAGRAEELATGCLPPVAEWPTAPEAVGAAAGAECVAPPALAVADGLAVRVVPKGGVPFAGVAGTWFAAGASWNAPDMSSATTAAQATMTTPAARTVAFCLRCCLRRD